jgi:hypothetical protein
MSFINIRICLCVSSFSSLLSNPSISLIFHKIYSAFFVLPTPIKEDFKLLKLVSSFSSSDNHFCFSLFHSSSLLKCSHFFALLLINLIKTFSSIFQFFLQKNSVASSITFSKIWGFFITDFKVSFALPLQKSASSQFL